jgi:hypothetical protein
MSISQHPLIEKLQNWAEMKINYPINKRNTQIDFSDNFHNVKNFVQVVHFENISKNRSIISFHRSRKYANGLKISSGKNVCV